MLYYGAGSATTRMTNDDLRSALREALEKIGTKKKVLALPPDITRAHSQAGPITQYAYEYYGAALTDIMPALGTHTAMTDAEREEMFGSTPKELFRVHKFRTDVVTLGEVPTEFIEKVSIGRGLPQERVHELARGRVWTGRQAEEAGLVDQLGGLQDAIDLARVMGRLPADSPLVEGPKAPDFFKQIEEAMSGMTRAASPVEVLLTEMGFENAVLMARELLRPRAALDPERVQAILPFDYVLR